MFCRQIYTLRGDQDREHDAVGGFEDLEQMVIAACCEVWSCGADEELLVCERREDQGEMFRGVEKIEV